MEQERRAGRLEPVTSAADSPDTIALIGMVAGRIRRFAEAIAQGHSFGIGPGVLTAPWTFAFQEQAVPVYATGLPWDYLLGLASGFEDCAELMRANSVPEAVALEWNRVCEYLASAAVAIRAGAPADVAEPEARSAQEIRPATPPVMPFRLLAEMLSVDAVAELQAAGAAVERWCGSVDSSPLTDQEADWLRRMIRGDRVLDIAIASGYSERALYRALSDLWDRLSVDNRNEAIALVVENGWL